MASNNGEVSKLIALRGAITSEENSVNSIEISVNKLIKELIIRNNLSPAKIVSIVFSVTKDLDACFPASIARKQPGWEKIALLDCQQMYVKNDLKRCIRILAHVLVPHDHLPRHTYLGEAELLRPDIS